MKSSNTYTQIVTIAWYSCHGHNITESQVLSGNQICLLARASRYTPCTLRKFIPEIIAPGVFPVVHRNQL